jgi:hypothetical protein
VAEALGSSETGRVRETMTEPQLKPGDRVRFNLDTGKKEGFITAVYETTSGKKIQMRSGYLLVVVRPDQVEVEPAALSNHFSTL